MNSRQRRNVILVAALVLVGFAIQLFVMEPTGQYLAGVRSEIQDPVTVEYRQLEPRVSDVAIWPPLPTRPAAAPDGDPPSKATSDPEVPAVTWDGLWKALRRAWRAVLRNRGLLDPETNRAGNTATVHLDQTAVTYETAATVFVDNDPVLPHSGEMTYTHPIVRVPGTGRDFSFVLSYRSGYQYDGPVGHNWDHNWNARIRDNEDSTGDITRLAGNRKDTYPEGNTDVFSSPTGFFESSVTRDAGNQYVFIFRTLQDGTVETYTKFNEEDVWYWLTEVKHRDTDNVITLYYDHGNNDRLTQIEDTRGRDFKLDYDSDGRLTDFEDWSGGGNAADRVWTFTYETGTYAGRLLEISTPAVGGASRTTAFTYDWISSYPHSLGSVTAPREEAQVGGAAYLKMHYDASGRVTTQQFGPTSSYVYSLSYHTPTNTFTEVDRESTQRIYMMDGSTGAITKIRVNVGGSYKDTSYDWNEDALLTKVTLPGGNGQQYVYDEGRLVTSAQSTSSGLSSAPARNSSNLLTEYSYQETANWTMVNGITDPEGNTWSLTRDAVGNITTFSLPGNAAYPWTMTYDSRSRVSTVTDPKSRVTDFDYGATGLLEDVTVDPSGAALATTYTRDKYGNVTDVEDPEGNTWQYGRNVLGYVTKITSPEGRETDYTYDLNDLVVTTLRDNDNGDITNAEHKLVMEYNLLDIVTKVEEYYDSSHGSHRDRTYAYDKEDRLTLTTLPEGNVVRVYYDNRGLMTSRTVAYGTPDATTTSFSYDSNGNLNLITDGLSNVTDHDYDGFDRLTKVTDGEGHYRTTAYDDNGNITASRAYSSGDAKLAETLHEYDDDNLLTKSKQWAKKADLSTNIGSGTLERTFAYDQGGLLTEKTDPCGCGGGTDMVYQYDGASRLTRTIDAMGNEVVYVLDGNGRPESITRDEDEDSPDPAYVTEYEYDDDGYLTEVSDRGDGGTQTALTTTYTVDGFGRVRQVTDPNANVVRYYMDDFGRVTKTERTTGVSSHIDTETEFDLNDNVVKRVSVRPGTDAETDYLYDNADRISITRDEADTTEQFSYDAAGNLDEFTDRNGSETTYSYDDRNLVVTKTYSCAADIVGPTALYYWYDGLGRITKAYNQDTLVTRTWNTLSKLEEEKLWIEPDDSSGTGTIPRDVTYTYDAAGLVSEVAYPDDKYKLSKVYDDLNRVAQIKRKKLSGSWETVATWTFQGPSRMKTLTLGNDVQEAMTYDVYGRADQMTWDRPYEAGRADIYEFARGYDSGSRPTYERRNYYDNSGGALVGQRDFGDRYYYDKINRLTKVLRGVGSGTENHSLAETASESTTDLAMRTRYTLDDGGNRQTLYYDDNAGNIPQVVRREDHTFDIENQLGNREVFELEDEDLVPISDTDYTWDANGNMVSTTDLADRYKVDMENRIYEWGEWRYRYDPFGRRIEKTDGEAYWRRCYYDGLVCIQEFEAYEDEGETYEKNDAYWSRIYGPYLIDQILWGEYDPDSDDETTNDTFYFCLDFLGTVVMLTDDPTTGDPEIQESYRYDEYGEAYVYSPSGTTRTGSDYEQDYLYTGRRWDPELELYYYRARYYCPGMGVFGGRDPIGPDRLLNYYSYVDLRPLDRVDATGRQALDIKETRKWGEMVRTKCHRYSPDSLIATVTDDAWWPKNWPRETCGPCPPISPGNALGDGWCRGGFPHTGAKDCFRSYGHSGDCGQQCCYDDEGNLIQDGTDAQGTVDLFRPSSGEDASGECLNHPRAALHVWEEWIMDYHVRGHARYRWIHDCMRRDGIPSGTSSGQPVSSSRIKDAFTGCVAKYYQQVILPKAIEASDRLWRGLKGMKI